MDRSESIHTYIRPSTSKQTDEHQRSSIEEYLEERGVGLEDVNQYVDVGSGADDEREQFQDLLDHIRSKNVDHVVVWEISRISRRGATLQEFFDICENNGVTIHITDGAVEKVKPDGTGRFVADIVGMVYQQERRQLIRRVESGVRRAKSQGKWLGQVPAGFKRNDDGYLRPIINPKEDEDSYIEMADALERVEEGNSYRSVARSLSISRQGLSNIHQDDERRQWYLRGEADDKRVEDALKAFSEQS
ncbi:site-specific recombinase, DNA invertase Pin [Halodesulfurarchaeum formicicum]|uniref:Site-specific recombinase, DNA invertase Pin n=1 Tax=Halodesulfurarchaeum formicicum TaxID=1873524 RepID=A0A1D8S441_9EURY|nr:recombinase family protein [Halodesulfurarchaeum formicicum]AOW80118.1 site-specific recombinase, DNA invertase Pin [Halodesulfurarchaeum formicicum]